MGWKPTEGDAKRNEKMNIKETMKHTACLFLLCSMFACGAKPQSKAAESGSTTTQTKPSVSFNADSAYAFVERQVAFGPRVPNTEAHKACGNYLANELRRFGAKVYEQEATLTAYNGDRLQSKNIVGAFNPDAEKRVLLFAHWDTRPYADHDADEANHRQAIDGADDGGSGVGVLLELARLIGKTPPNVGIDIIFFDAEDHGAPTFVQSNKMDDWCLGSQFWAKHPHVKNYKADFGILLDMVGTKNAVFYKELTSVRYAARYVELVWEKARQLGYGKYFINANGGGVVDDHEYVIRGRGIPCIDIINYDPESEKGFGHYWHTMDDTMKNIDKETLHAVGHTVLEVIYAQ